MKKNLFIFRAGLLSLALLFFVTSSYALNIDIQSAKENGSTYSTIHIENPKPFICEALKDEFGTQEEIKCYFSKAPIRNFSNVENPFFKMHAVETAKLYIVSIKPKKKMKLFHLGDDLAQRKRVIHQEIRYAKHWFIIGYDTNIPLISHKKVPLHGVSFPIDFANETLPFVGALGLDGHPIEMNQVAEVSDYLEIKKHFTRGQYDEVLSTIDKALDKDPNTIFKSEFLLYKIKTKIKQDELADSIDLCKDFLREFSNNEGVPEVLFYLAQASSSMGLIIDAEYFYDRLLSEHYDSKEATRGLIALGEHTSSKGDADKALKYYLEALSKAETKELASTTAFRIANFYLTKGNVKQAAYYVQKIATGNVEFLLNDYQRSFDIAKEFSDHEAYNEAADLMLELLKTFDKSDRRYESTLYQIAVWYDLGNSNEKAYKHYDKYVKAFEFGDYLTEIEERMDKVLFEIGDDNSTKLLALYDTITQKYQSQEIANKAKALKGALLYKEKEYQKVLDMQGTLKSLNIKLYPEALGLIALSAKALATKELENKQCANALTLLRAYDFNMTQAYSDSLYRCTMDVRDYKEAKALAEPYIYEKDLSKRLLWLYRYVKSSSKTGDMKTVYVMGDDLLSLAAVENTHKYDDIKLDIFKAARALNKDDKALDLIINIEKTLGLRFREIELYVSMVKLAKAKKDYTMLETYATKVTTLQAKHKSYSYSPSVEFMLLNALKKLNKNAKAYRIAKALTKHISKPEELARAYYELGIACQRLNYQSQMQKAFEKSVTSSKNSAWSKLSQDALDLL